MQMTLIDLRCTDWATCISCAGTFVAVGRNGAAKPPRDREDNVAHPDRHGPPLVPVLRIAN
jgi:hypothetical protein